MQQSQDVIKANNDIRSVTLHMKSHIANSSCYEGQLLPYCHQEAGMVSDPPSSMSNVLWAMASACVPSAPISLCELLFALLAETDLPA